MSTKTKTKLIKLNNTELQAVANDVVKFFHTKREREREQLKKKFKMTPEQREQLLKLQQVERYFKAATGESLGRYDDACERFKALIRKSYLEKLDREGKITKVPEYQEVYRLAVMINASKVGSAPELAGVLVIEFTV